MSFQSVTDFLNIVEEIVPASRTTGSYGTLGTAIDLTGWEGCVFIAQLGTIASTGTFDMKVQSAAASAFSTAHDLTSAALVQVAAAGASKMYAIDVKTQTVLAAQSGDKFLRVACQADGSNAVLYGVIAIQYRRNGPLPVTTNLVQLVEV